jgi:hypothetical protein
MEEVEIETPLEGMTAGRLGKPVVFVAVFRAGLGLIDAALDLVPDARIGYAGVQRNEETAEPMEYYTKFPQMGDARVIILEPMLATGGSLEWAVSKVKAHGATDITAVCVVAAPVGVEAMENTCTPTSGWSRRRSTGISTITSTSGPVSATWATGCSGLRDVCTATDGSAEAPVSQSRRHRTTAHG